MKLPIDEEREDRILMRAVVDAYGSEERAIGWYCYLENELRFPFRVKGTHRKATSPLQEGAHHVVSRMAVRFDGEAGRIGLDSFLGALSEGDHWLLVADLDGGLLPFAKQRVRSAELRTAGLPGERILVIENESCQHLLPAVPGTVAILGAGFDLSWMDGPWLGAKKVAYWGDLDTWGLRFLAVARSSVPHLLALMMSPEVFVEYARSAVAEPVPAGREIPSGLIDSEGALYERLLRESNGRLEQEFLPAQFVREVITQWAQL